MGKMKAVFYKGKDCLEVGTAEIPGLQEGEVLIRVKYAGICGTDLSILAGKHPRAKPPLIMGHEFSGEIFSLGSSRTNLKEGDRVVVEPLISCGRCFACRSGYAYVCEKLGLFGIDAPGAFAEYIKVPEEKVFRIPKEVPLDQAALIEPVAVAVHTVRLSSLKLGDTVCVQGAGPIGLLTAVVASRSGAGNVLITEKETVRIEIAESFGMRVIDVGREDTVDVVEKATNGRGADIVFEAAGAPQTVLLSPKLCRVRGEIIQVAIPKDPREMDLVGITFKELTIKGIRVYAPYDFERAIHLLSQTTLDLRRLLSSPYSLDQAKEAFKKAAEGKETMRVLFSM
jgi:2-desacetyl-2-hydroxyethyl bacteriochlorophyllide A dehydrogenase